MSVFIVLWLPGEKERKHSTRSVPLEYFYQSSCRLYERRPWKTLTTHAIPSTTDKEWVVILESLQQQVMGFFCRCQSNEGKKCVVWQTCLFVFDEDVFQIFCESCLRLRLQISLKGAIQSCYSIFDTVRQSSVTKGLDQEDSPEGFWVKTRREAAHKSSSRRWQLACWPWT